MEDIFLDSRHFLDYWRVIRARKETIIAVALTITIAGWLVTVSLPKVYSASTKIQVSHVRPDVPVSEMPDPDMYYSTIWFKTQLEVLKSQLVLDKVIQDLNLQDRFAQARKAAGGITLADARVELERNIRIKPQIDTSVIEIEVRRNRPQDTVRKDVANIANQIANTYLEVSTETVRDRTEHGVNALDGETQKYNKLVLEKEKAVEDLRSKLSISLLAKYRGGGNASMLEQIRLTDLEDFRNRALQTMQDKEMRLKRVENLEGDELLYTLQFLLGDGSLGSLRRQLTDARLKLQEMEPTRGERHPDVVQQKAVLDELNREIAAAVTGARSALQADYDIAKKNYEAMDRELSTEKTADIENSRDRYLLFFKAEEELEDLKKLRDRIKMRAIEERIDMGLPQSPIKVLSYAEEPGENEHVAPILPVNLLLSVFLGLCCGIGLAFFVEYMDTSVKNIEDIERLISVPVLGVIPQKVKLLLDAGDDSPHAEAYRVLRTNMQFSKRLGRGKAVCITSGGAGEGKSFTLSNLAYVTARLGDRVLIVDSDMRRPKQHKLLGVSVDPGLVDVLMGKAKIEEVIRETPVPNLYFMASGKATVATTGLLDTDRMSDVIDYLKGQFDVIYFDAPPIIGVSDASVLVSRLDAVLMVIQHRSYPRDVSYRAKKLIENVGGNLLGVVLNNINLAKDYSHYYSMYGSAYGIGRQKRVAAPVVAGAVKPGAEEAHEAASGSEKT